MNPESGVLQPLPRTVEELTVEWLSAAICSQYSGVSIKGAATQHILWGTATKVLMELTYEGDYTAHGLPTQVCVKGEFDEKMRAKFADVEVTGTQAEADFYNDLSAGLGLPLIRCWFAGSEPRMGILILDDWSKLGGTFGEPTMPWSSEHVGRALDILARLHAMTWGKRFPNLAWLQVGSPAVRQYTSFLMSAEHWEEHFRKPEVFQLPSALADRELNLRGLHALWEYDDDHAQCVVHGDAHLGNTAIDKDGAPFFIDWAGPSFSCWAQDVAYFVAGALSVADRRASEKDLLEQYLVALAEHGGPTLDRTEAWDDYRRHMLHGLGWCTLPSLMQSPENVHAMGERYSTAMVELDTLQLLGVSI